MEAEKSHDWSSASMRPRKASSIVQSKPEGLRAREANGVSPGPSPLVRVPKPENWEAKGVNPIPSLIAWGPGAPMSKGGRNGYSSSNKEQIHRFSTFLFYSGSQ